MTMVTLEIGRVELWPNDPDHASVLSLHCHSFDRRLLVDPFRRQTSGAICHCFRILGPSAWTR